MILPQDTTQLDGQSTAYDTIWTGAEAMAQTRNSLESVMLSHDKLYVVLAVATLHLAEGGD